MKKSLLLSGILSLVVAIALLAGCAFEQPASDEEAIVEVTIVQDMFSTKTIEPVNSMDITEYLLKWDTISPPAANTKTVTPTGGTTTVYLLLSPGETYYFQIEGYNLDGDKIGASTIEGPIEFGPGSKVAQQVSLTIEPIVGTGNLEVTVDWSTVDLGSYVLDAEVFLDIFDSSVTDFTTTPLHSFTADPDAGATAATVKNETTDDPPVADPIDNGYYKCIIKMVDESDGALLWTAIDALRIVADDFISTETYNLVQGYLDALVAVKVDENMQDPLDIELRVVDDTANTYYYADDTLPVFTISKENGSALVVEAWPIDRSTTQSTSVDSFEWYLDGTIDATAWKDSEDLAISFSRYRIPSGSFNIGSYSLSVLVKKDGTLSSRTLQFVVE